MNHNFNQATSRSIPQPNYMQDVEYVPYSSVVPPVPAHNFAASSAASTHTTSTTTSRTRLQPAPPPFLGSSQPSSTDTLPVIGQHFTDNPYKRVSSSWDPTIAQLADMDIVHDNIQGDSDEEDYAQQNRSSAGTNGGRKGKLATTILSPKKQPAGGFLTTPTAGYDALNNPSSGKLNILVT